MTIKGLKWGRALTAFVFVAAIISGPFVQMQATHATGGTATWTGTAGDNKFSTAGNWEDDTLPVNGDVLVFNQSGAGVTLDNDLDLLYGGVTTGATSGFTEYNYQLTNDLRLAPGATLQSLGNIFLMYGFGAPGKFVATGDLTINGPYILTGNEMQDTSYITYSGHVTVQNNARVFTATGMTGITLDNGTLLLGPGTNANLTVTGTAGSQIYTNDSIAPTTTLSGAVTLNSNLGVHVDAGRAVEFTGTITDNGHSITKTSGTGTLTVSGSAGQAPATTVSYDNVQATTDETVGTNEIATLNGTRQDIDVNGSGTLKGTGTARNVTVLNGGVIAPGNSPGTITVTDVFDLYGTYQAEILNKDTYDKVIAGEGAAPGTVTVLLRAGSSLDTILYAGWSVTAGDTFTIIDNRGDQPVSGTFDNLPEGQQFTVNGITFNITYTGGDGNDVVLTALTTGSAPAVGNTGAHLSLANPAVIAVLGIIAGAAVLLVARRSATKR